MSDPFELTLFDPEALDDPWDAASDPSLLTGPSAITSLGVRAKAVAYTRPLHDLEANKGRLGGEAWSKLNLIELGFHAIDVVALRMDFDSGARHDDVIAALATLARYQDPDLEDAHRVGEKVLEGLITGRGGSDAEAHQAVYGSWGPDGYVAKRFDYALLTEHVDEDGEFYLRATDPAISVLMGALELDVESAQIASELRLNELVKRGLLTAAIGEARRAKYRSIQYMNQLQRQIAHAQMHPTEPGTLGAVDRLVEHALAHVVERYQAERAIVANVAATRDNADDPVARRRANQLIVELEECGVRHQHLQRRLVRARREFRAAHAEQLAAGPPPASRVDLERQLLRPVLRAPLAAADRLASLLFRLATAPQPPPLVDLDQLTGALCALPSTGDDLGDRVGVGDDALVDVDERRRFDDDTWDAVDAVLAGVEGPTRLSELVAQVTAAPDGLPDQIGARAHLLALRALHEFDPALSEQLRHARTAAALDGHRTIGPAGGAVGETAGGAGDGTAGAPGEDARLRWWRPTGDRLDAGALVGDDLAVFPAWLDTSPDPVGAERAAAPGAGGPGRGSEAGPAAEPLDAEPVDAEPHRAEPVRAEPGGGEAGP
ncbi:MAG TPA: hypothetical protein VIL48_09855 [Acidimicrobiales bacterium]